MSFLPGIDVKQPTATGTPFLSFPTPVFQPSTVDVAIQVESGTSFVATGQGVFSAGLDVGKITAIGIAFINAVTPVLSTGDEVFISTLDPSVGDTGLLIILGLQLDFNGVPTAGSAPLNVTFNNLSGGPITQFFWDFGDGFFAFTQDPKHTYTKVGVYAVSLQIKVGLNFFTYRRNYIRVYPGGLIVSRTTRCYRFAVLPEHGVGPFEILGADWPFPEARTGTIRVLDSNDQPHLLVLNNKDGFLYDISTRDGPPGTGLTRVWKDGADINGVGGTDILPAVLFPEDRGGFEHYFLEHKESHAYVRPYDEVVGLPAGIEFSVDVFTDGEPTNAAATTSDVPLDGDIGFDKLIEAHRLQMKFSANKSEHLIVGRQQYYVAKDRAAAPDKRVSTESDYEAEFALPLLWIWTIGGIPADRALEAALSLTVIGSTGPDGDTGSGISFTTAQTFPSLTMTGAGELILWFKGTLAVTIGVTPITLTNQGTFSGWTLASSSGITASGDLVVTPTGTVELFDMRAFNTAISSGAQAYYFNDVSNNNGNVMLVK